MPVTAIIKMVRKHTSNKASKNQKSKCSTLIYREGRHFAFLLHQFGKQFYLCFGYLSFYKLLEPRFHSGLFLPFQCISLLVLFLSTRWFLVLRSWMGIARWKFVIFFAYAITLGCHVYGGWSWLLFRVLLVWPSAAFPVRSRPGDWLQTNLLSNSFMPLHL